MWCNVGIWGAMGMLTRLTRGEANLAQLEAGMNVWLRRLEAVVNVWLNAARGRCERLAKRRLEAGVYDGERPE